MTPVMSFGVCQLGKGAETYQDACVVPHFSLVTANDRKFADQLKGGCQQSAKNFNRRNVAEAYLVDVGVNRKRGNGLGE